MPQLLENQVGAKTATATAKQWPSASGRQVAATTDETAVIERDSDLYERAVRRLFQAGPSVDAESVIRQLDEADNAE